MAIDTHKGAKCVNYMNILYFIILGIQGCYGPALCWQPVDYPSKDDEGNINMYNVASAMIIYRLIIALILLIFIILLIRRWCCYPIFQKLFCNNQNNRP